VIRTPRDFWIFHTAFWLLAAVVLFLYGLTYGHVKVAVVRNLYNPVVGFACSYLIRAVYENHFPATLGKRLSVMVALAFLGALVSALVANPITYALLGYELSELPMGNLLQDGLYFALLYLIWSLLYLQLSGKSLVAAPLETVVDETIFQGTINVTKGNQVFKLDPANISCIKASGDYVELCTDNASYLKQGTIGFYEKALNPHAFLRIHRSIIVNRDKIASVSSASKGQFWITMDDGQELRSSRRYQTVVESLTPEAP
jgi:DNA-binding LytR/AlgR family response regulator